ncbi:MAG: hypothetical protein ACRC92_17275 [Peptostreptococcaceae bacterium]
MNKGKIQYGSFAGTIADSHKLTPPGAAVITGEITPASDIPKDGQLMDPAKVGTVINNENVGEVGKPSLLTGLNVGKGVANSDENMNGKLSEVGQMLKEAREQGSANRFKQPKFMENVTKCLDEAAVIFLGVHGDTGAKLTELQKKDDNSRKELIDFKNNNVGGGTGIITDFFEGADEEDVLLIIGRKEDGVDIKIDANVKGDGLSEVKVEIVDKNEEKIIPKVEIQDNSKDNNSEQSITPPITTGDEVVVEDGDKDEITATDFGKEVEFDYENNAEKLEIIDAERSTYENILQIAAGRKDTKLPTNVLDRYKAPRGKHVEGYLPNSNLVISTYPFKKLIKRNDTAMRFMMADGKPENDRKILDNILSNVVVNCADGRALNTSELLDMIDVHDLKIIYLNSLIVNMVEEDPKNIYLTLSVPCESCGTTHNVKVNILNLYRDNIDVASYNKFKMYDKNKMSDELQKDMPVAKTKIVKFEDNEANLIISLALRGVSAERQFVIKDALKEYVVKDCKRLIPKEISDIDEQFMWVARNKPLEIQSKSSILGMIAPITAIKIEDKFNKANTSTITVEQHGISTLLEVIDSFSEDIITKMTKLYEDELSSKYPLDIHLRPFNCKSCDSRIIANVDPAQLYFFDLTQRTLQK